MNDTREIQKELELLNATRKAVKNDNTASSDFPKIKRTYTYRETQAVRSL